PIRRSHHRSPPPRLPAGTSSTPTGAARGPDHTGANGPPRPPPGAVRPRHAERPDSGPGPEGTSSGRPHSRTGLPRPNRLVTPTWAVGRLVALLAWGQCPHAYHLGSATAGRPGHPQDTRLWG